MDRPALVVALRRKDLSSDLRTAPTGAVEATEKLEPVRVGAQYQPYSFSCCQAAAGVP
jgi:hypothetical protein